ncbi:7621_t:CDS:2 [Ambispora leptoticha]|uniref:7621_t:CDS:1 n=1 Tax=Ambispora leptoticha TaxID=144679 RepID=A0A9N9C7B4_9GLOM|nr:7621_t:CDS:2 [Ambispora leptoticha]
MSQRILGVDEDGFTTLINMTEQLSIEKQSENDFPRNITSQVLGNLVESIRPRDPTIQSRIEAIVNKRKASSFSTTTINSKMHPRLLRRCGATMTQIRISICENFKFFYQVRLNRSYCTNTEFNLRIVAYELLALKQPNVPVSATVLKDMENSIEKWVKKKRLPDNKIIPILEKWMESQIPALTSEEQKQREMKRIIKVDI